MKHKRRKAGAIIKSRNRKVIDETPLNITCQYCGNVQPVTEENTINVTENTKCYWCEVCGEKIHPLLQLIEYKYS